MRYFSLILATLLTFTVFSQEQDPFLRQLGAYKSRVTMKDTVLINTIVKHAKDSSYTNSEKSLAYGRRSLGLSKSLEYNQGKVESYMVISKAKIYLNDLDSAMIYADMALALSKKIKAKRLIVRSHELRANIHVHKGDYGNAVNAYFETIKLAEKIDEKLAMTSYANVGLSFKRLGNYKKSRDYVMKAYNLGKKYKDTATLVQSLNILGLLEKSEKKPDKALEWFEEGLEYARLTNNYERHSQILYNMANIYFAKKEYDKGFELYNESMEISKVNGSYKSIAIGYHALAFTHYDIGDFNKAAGAADSALHYALLSENYHIIMESYAMMAEIYKQTGRIQDGFYFLELAYVYKDSMNLIQLNDAALSAENSYEKEKQRMEDSLYRIQQETKAAHDKKINDEKVRARENLIWLFAVVFILGGVGVYFLIKNNRLVKKQHALVNKQKEEIQHQHKEITDSINYAQRIQEAIIKKEGEWQKISSEYFIFFRPKDVVSGDFYWAYNNVEENLSIWAVADCTGHGVPGAFMSMLGSGFLNEIIIEDKHFDPGEILDLLRSRIIGALTHKGEAKTKDGMDISICVWNKATNKLKFAGANNPLWIVRHKSTVLPDTVRRITEIPDSALQLLEITPDKMPVGYYFETPPPFKTQEIDMHPGDLLIMLTDGFPDQFGGAENKKYKYATLKKKLIEWQSKPTNDQLHLLETEFDSWKGHEEQVDDVCVVGVKIVS